ncbi:MAG: LrgB family protein [Bacteroidaceae bacterium]|nr:LrgB family protein [Bacteroidaceae bacterium]MBQ8542303.1 LrgB family protein [Bacteroidaceae bacterium]
MKELLSGSLFFGATLSIGMYAIGLWVKKRRSFFLFNPVLIAIVGTIATLLILDIDYSSYNNGAKYITYLLTPATVALAIPLYEQVSLLRKNLTAIMVGITSGVLASFFSIFALALLFALNHTQYVTLLPKSITTAIGIGLSQELGGYVAITVSAIILTGLFGNIAGEHICRLLSIKHPVAKGLSIGTATHVMGTAKAMEMGEIEGAMSSLSVAVAGCITVGVAVIFEHLI